MNKALRNVSDGFEHELLAAPILIVEDNEISRLFLERTLRSAGYFNTVSVDNAKKALEEIQRLQPELIILDVIMPDMDGFACCNEIRKRLNRNQLPVLMQTVLSEPELRVKAFSMGATDFISKPVFPAELCARVRVHLEKSLGFKSLQRYKERIENELRAARDLQLSILPQPHEIGAICQNGQLDVAALFTPALEIGGDFWGTKSLSANKKAIWLVDFSGHGVSSALNTFRLQAYLKEYCTIMTCPGDYLSYLNDKLRHLLMRGQFATMFYGVIDTTTNMLELSCASCPHPIIKDGANGETRMIDGSGSPLGMGAEYYKTKEIAFNPGNVLCLYSDAMIETEDAEGNYIDEKDIAHWLEQCPPRSSAEHIKHYLLQQFYRRVGHKVSDDLTLVVLTRKGA